MPMILNAICVCDLSLFSIRLLTIDRCKSVLWNAMELKLILLYKTHTHTQYILVVVVVLDL